jgi:hypothetical protein
MIPFWIVVYVRRNGSKAWLSIGQNTKDEAEARAAKLAARRGWKQYETIRAYIPV